MRNKSRIRVAISLHQGRRSYNEDNFYSGEYIYGDCKKGRPLAHKINIPNICAVCDGMGGLTKGSLASKNAVTFIKEHKGYILDQLNKRCYDKNQDSKVVVWINQFINNLNASMSSSMKNQVNYGSTLAMVVLDRYKIYVSNVGDSRVYALINNSIKQITVDHNQRTNAMAFGFKPEDSSWGRNILTQYLGMPKDRIILEPHVISLDYSPMTILVCSDGLTEVLDEKEILNLFLASRWRTLKSLSKKYIQRALDNGSKDNITVMLIRIKN